MVEINFTLVVFTASFILFLIAMKLAFFDQVKNIIHAREEKIKLDLAESKKALSQFEASENSTENPTLILKESRLKAQEIISEAMSSSNTERQNMINRELKDIKANAEASVLKLEKEQRETLRNLDTHVAELTKEAVDKLMSEFGAHATA